MKIIIYGYGNLGRNDDGLGVKAALEIEKWIEQEDIENVAVDTNYQLNIEDAAEIAPYDIAVFVDATINDDVAEYRYSEVEPNPKTEFTMHAVSPAFILSLCMELNEKVPEVYLLEIRGYDWEFVEKFSEGAKQNLAKAVDFLKNLINETNN